MESDTLLRTFRRRVFREKDRHRQECDLGLLPFERHLL